MLQDIVDEARYASRMIGRSELSPNVLDAIAKVPRERFVDVNMRRHAFDNSPLPIGRGQTISQPFIVALMTDLANPAPENRVLEVGTGSGYQTAVMSLLVRQLYSIEIIPELADDARLRFDELNYSNIVSRIGDGYFGWQEEAPFDVILVTAAAAEAPPHLPEQLAPGGRLVLPVGGRFYGQDLLLLEKDESGNVTEKSLLPVAFVPMTGEH
ncbi:MAG: protein-L-isoaspartate O-methyltransferase [endosymbiont of Seepiophila jonesi]|uniref:Protein-L-isoaspartate O-methyltransferase n=1 Tax=endosymbiont of Lamellibrachia luymesi TaxID=2200907 RepID=A0A370DNR3_9GAMM|nr:MAG: protein-L-isoaspartate O-methyltransferase [endosymbiont of Lamellibrachia luymesi]RDH93888.1 MAG: protein-L-isoaspartate O-methyltransferase [endosymbiont of Seepiophila jonesi]